MAWHRWKPYVPVAQRRLQALRKMNALRKKGVDIQPIEIKGRKIARTFWGEAWCDHIESFSDFANRLPRGRTYVRNGSVCHLAIEKGTVEAKVSGSSLYEIRVRIKTLPAEKWTAIKRQCSGQIGSLLELLRGDLSGNIMQVVTDRRQGLFPLSNEISFDCDCPDWAVMCKHVAAVLYGIGARLDQDPALLFRLRGVKHDELIDVDAQVAVPAGSRRGGGKRLASDDLGDVFGIDLTADEPKASSNGQAKRKAAKTPPATKKSTAKRKASSRRSATTGTKKAATGKKKSAAAKKKAATRKKKATKVAKKTTARKSTTKKSTTRKSTRRKKKSAAGKTTTAGRVKQTTARQATTKKTAKKTAKRKAAKTSRKQTQPVS